MMFGKRMIAGAAGLVLVAGMNGCGTPSGDTSTTEATVKGVVKLNGKPATEGEISFDASNYQRQVAPKVAPIGKDGSYTISTLVGPNTVKLGGSLLKKYEILSYRQKNMKVDRGDNTFDFETETR